MRYEKRKLKITSRAGSLAPDREPNKPITSWVKTTFGLRGIYMLFHSLLLGHRRSIELYSLHGAEAEDGTKKYRQRQSMAKIHTHTGVA